MSGVNPDLQRERDQATFDAEQLTYILYGGPEKTARRRYIENLAFSDPDFQYKNHNYWSRDEAITEAARLGVLVVKKLKHLHLTDPDEISLYKRAAMGLMFRPFNVHEGMFMQTVLSQTTEEQKQRWMKKVENYEIVGTYAQTEMGHGTFLRGLETIAIYDESTQEFVLNTPTITATKWWPGNLGKNVNYAVVMAQLHIKNKNCGMQPFMVPLRSLEDHKPLPGITIGDIGPKLGMDSNDNGFLRLNNVRVPRTNMLMKNAEVQPDGTFVQLKNPKLTYGVMVLMRALILKMSTMALAQSCTIATRYSAVRRQTEIRPGYEPQILYYQTQQHKLLSHIAAAYAFWFVSDHLYAMYEQTQAEIASGQQGRLPELHGVLSGLKAFVTFACNDGIEALRMSCGGHGYSHASGIPWLYTSSTAGCTYEGENTVMYLQCARFLVKAYSGRLSGTLTGSVQYLARDHSDKFVLTDSMDIRNFVAVYERRAFRLIAKAAEKLAQLQENGISQEEAWNLTSVQLVKAAAAHSHLFVVNTFVDELLKICTPPSVSEVLNQLCRFYVVGGILKNSGDFLQDGCVTDAQISVIEESYLHLLSDMRSNAEALVDAFDYSDRHLNSALGRHDGHVYEALYKFAVESPLNKTDVHDSYFKYLRPFIKDFKTAKL